VGYAVSPPSTLTNEVSCLVDSWDEETAPDRNEGVDLESTPRRRAVAWYHNDEERLAMTSASKKRVRTGIGEC